ncbi:MAG: hypothetical protein IPO93_02405 [Actinobacteria bacterium]|nr:hypothetical protein [Actinomycetota bacterium]
MIGRRTTGCAGVLAAVLWLTGCGSAETEPVATTPVTAPVIAPMPTANAFTSAIMATRSMGTATVEVDVTIEAPGRPVHLRADGGAVLTRGRGDLMWTSDSGTFREVVNDQAIFTQDRPPEGPWVRTPKESATTTSGFTDPLRGLGVLQDVTGGGPATEAGVATSRFLGWLPADDAELTGLGLTSEQVAAHRRDRPDGRVGITVWLDPYEHVVRVDRQLPEAGPDAPGVDVSTRLTDFSVLLDLTSPRGSVIDAPSS